MRYELTDFEWAAIRSFLPNKPRGIPRVDDRRILNGIFWVLRSGAPGATCRCPMVPAPLAIPLKADIAHYGRQASRVPKGDIARLPERRQLRGPANAAARIVSPSWDILQKLPRLPQ